ncbi:MAG: hypothetical protein ACFBZ9_09255 [Sphingomonadales bacterium]
MSFTLTAWLLGLAVVIFAGSLYFGRKAEPLTRLSYVPWTALQFTALVAIFVLGAHLFSEWRGEPLIGTRSPLRGL